MLKYDNYGSENQGETADNSYSVSLCDRETWAHILKSVAYKSCGVDNSYPLSGSYFLLYKIRAAVPASNEKMLQWDGTLEMISVIVGN